LGLNATELGLSPTAMVEATVPVFTVITDTLSTPWFVTYANFPSGLNATDVG
jgi:hypothetical protein